MVHSGSLAGVAQLVEHKLPKLGVAGSNPVARSRSRSSLLFNEGFPFLRGLGSPGLLRSVDDNYSGF